MYKVGVSLEEQCLPSSPGFKLAAEFSHIGESLKYPNMYRETSSGGYHAFKNYYVTLFPQSETITSATSKRYLRYQ
jgi:hypothetical protein